jgi:hypothetical protein
MLKFLRAFVSEVMNTICQRSHPYLVFPPTKFTGKANASLHAPDRYFTYHYNFINSGDDPLHDLGSVNPWLSCRLSSLEQAPSVPALLQNGTIEATLWIFISGYPPGSIPTVDPTVRRRAAKLNVSIYFEHYFESESDAETGPWPTRLVIKHDTDDFIR